MNISKGEALGVVGLAMVIGAIAIMYPGMMLHTGEPEPPDTVPLAAETEPAAPPPPATFEECVRHAIDVYDAHTRFTWETPTIKKGFIMHAEIILCERQFPAEARP